MKIYPCFKLLTPILLLLQIASNQELQASNPILKFDQSQDTIPINEEIDYDTLTFFNQRTYQEVLEILPKYEAILRKQQIENHKVIKAESYNSYHPDTYEESYAYHYREGDTAYRIYKEEGTNEATLDSLVSVNPTTRKKETWYRLANEPEVKNQRLDIDTIIVFDYETYEESLQIMRIYHGEAHQLKRKNHSVIESESFVTYDPMTYEESIAYHYRKDGDPFQIFKTRDPNKTIIETIVSFNPKTRKPETWYRFKEELPKVTRRIRIDTITTFDPETYEEQMHFNRIYEGETPEQKKKRLTQKDAKK